MSAEQQLQQAGKFHYGWIVSCGSFFNQFAAVLCVSAAGICMTYLSEGLGVTTAEAGLMSTLFGLSYGGLTFVWGYIADKIGPRKSSGIAAIIAGVFMILVGLAAQTLAMAVVFYFVAGIGVAGLVTSFLPKIIPAWFMPSIRGRGMIPASLGGTIAGFLLGIVGPMIIAASSWRGYWIAIGIVVLVFCAITFIIVRDKPADKGLLPVGWQEGDVIPEEPEKPKGQIVRALKMPETWKGGIVYIFYQGFRIPFQAFIVAGFVAAGYEVPVAAFCLSMNTLGMTIGQIIWPIVSDKVARKYIIAIASIISPIVLLIVYMFVLGNAPIYLWVSIVFYGLACGMNPVIQTQCAELFPPDIRGTGTGLCGTISTVGNAGGPLLVSTLMMMTGLTVEPWFMMLGCSAILCALTALIFFPKTGGKYGDPWTKHVDAGANGK